MPLGLPYPLSNIVEDTTPELGGDLDVNGKSIVSVSDGNILIDPDGDGLVGVKLFGDPVERFNIAGNIGFEQVDDVTGTQYNAITLTEDSGAGSLDAGEYFYDFRFVTDEGRTTSLYSLGRDPLGITVGANGAVNITGIPISPDPRVTGRMIMRTAVGQVKYLARPLYTIDDNTTTSWTDDGSLTPSGAINYQSGNSTGGGITIDGVTALKLDTYNAIVGYEAAPDYTGYDSVCVGSGAGNSMTTCSSSIMIGSSAGRDVTTGSSNIMIGRLAGWRIDTGANNIWIGSNAYPASGANSSDENVVVGIGAGQSGPQLSSHNGNVMIGFEAGKSRGGAQNILIGKRAGMPPSSQSGASYNICIGGYCGQDITTAQRCLLIGNGIDVVDPALDYQLNIMDTIIGITEHGGGEGVITLDAVLQLIERSADPSAPAEGQCVIWMSDGTGKGDDGDVLIASTAGGTTKWATLFDHSAGAAW